jgi:AP2-associated kinase
MAPPKPTHLNKNTTVNILPAGERDPPYPNAALPGSFKTRAGTSPGERLVAVDLPGQPTLDMTPAEKDDYVRSFQERFPSLTSIEMVERDLAAEAEGKPGR